MEMTRHIKPLYIRVHLNGRPISKVLIDNGSAVNVMSLRMLRALGRGINDLIEIEVVVSTFIGEVSKTLGILPIDITIGSKTALSAFFMIDSLQITTFCSGGTGLMPTGVCRPLFISSYCFGKVMKWKWCK